MNNKSNLLLKSQKPEKIPSLNVIIILLNDFSYWKTKCVFRAQKYFTIIFFLVSKQYHSCYFLCIQVPLTIDLKLISFKFSFTCALKPNKILFVTVYYFRTVSCKMDTNRTFYLKTLKIIFFRISNCIQPKINWINLRHYVIKTHHLKIYKNQRA